MTQVRDVLGRARPLVVAVAFVAASFIPLLSIHSASADALTNRSLQTTSSVESDQSTSIVAGTAANGNEVGHTYTFTANKAGTIEAITFEVCASAFGYLGNCTTTDQVAGFNVTNTFATAEVNNDVWTFTKVDADEWALTDTTGLVVAPNTPLTITVEFPASETESFTNPTTTGTYFVHVATFNDSTVTTYSEAAFLGAQGLDEGTVTSSTATAIDINTRVEETLRFSIEGDMRDGPDNANSGTPTAGSGAFNGPTSAASNCAPLTGLGTIRMGDQASNALGIDATYDAASYFRLATNSSNGARVLYVGDTLRSGSTETITAIGAAGSTIDDPIAENNEQFGLGMIAVPNLAGTTTEVDRDGGGSYLNAVTGYGAGDTLAGFESTTTTPVLLASSNGIVQCDTGAVRYIANIAEETAAGIYTTRIVYIASPSY